MDGRNLIIVFAHCALLVACTTVQPDHRLAKTPIPASACLVDTVGPLAVPESERPYCAAAADLRCSDACAAGDAMSCYLRAVGSERAFPADRETFSALYRRSCELGLPIGCTNYAAFLWRFGDHAANRCAQRIFQKTCAADEQWGCGMLGRLIIDDEKASPADLARGSTILQAACEKHGRFSCRVLALELEGGKLGPADPATIARLLARACATGDPDGCGEPLRAADTFGR